MSANTFPAQIEPFKWAEQGFTWSGTLPLSRFARIAREAVGSIDDQLINIDCKLSMDAYHRIVWLDGHVETNVPMECQRCLGTVNIELVSDFHLALVDDESLIERLDEDLYSYFLPIATIQQYFKYLEPRNLCLQDSCQRIIEFALQAPE